MRSGCIYIPHSAGVLERLDIAVLEEVRDCVVCFSGWVDAAVGYIVWGGSSRVKHKDRLQ